ncbi:BatA and WFA domain-containing protein, partial [Candidatus Sumerlaeota bacterium]|nr:BatA and WFA domain-containing protein [Candidatus Sumerlaeota bacterium]
LAFLAPLFLGGLALLVAPWLIHQIRRPEREITRFSSLMFVPQTRKEVIERRRLQHILLMLMRMAMLTLLALAFARPYWRNPAAAGASTQGAAWHIILLDASYSMGDSGWFEQARAKALSIVASLGPADRVGVIVFDRTPKTVAPLVSDENPSAGSPAAARQAIESAQLSEETTAYVPALEAAQAMFASVESQSARAAERFVIHLISDFQRAGLPDKNNRWKLDPRCELRCIEVGRAGSENCAIEDVSVQEPKQGELQVRGKVRNWSKALKASREIKLMGHGQENARTALTIEPGAARQVAFRIPVAGAPSFEGWLELNGDPLALDNRRYFVRQAAAQRRVLLLASEDSERSRSATRFLSSALPPKSDLPWRLEIQAPSSAKDTLLNEDKRPSILVVADLDRLTAEIAKSIQRYVETGGRVLLMVDLSDKSDMSDLSDSSDALNKEILSRWGIRADGPRGSEKREGQFIQLSWIDFDHPIFFPLRGPQFNDFSTVHFYNHQRLSVVKSQVDTGTAENPRVIARFEPDSEGKEWPAMIEARAGE